MSRPDERQRANEAALRASRAWLLGRSLAAELDEMRFEGEGGPVPAPGLQKLLGRLEKDLRDVCDLADSVALLLSDLDQIPDLGSKIKIEVDAAEEGADEMEMVARRIAQLAFGVSSGLGPSARVERLDRAAVAVLYPPAGAGTQHGLVHDGIELFARRNPDLVVELGGIIRRMLRERGVTVHIGPLGLRVGDDDVLHMVTDHDHRCWESPVQATEPAREAMKVLKASGMSIMQIRDAAVASWWALPTL